VCVMAERSIDPVADILAVAIVLHGKRTMSKTPHTIYKGMLLDIYSRHQVNCTCQSGHALPSDMPLSWHDIHNISIDIMA